MLNDVNTHAAYRTYCMFLALNRHFTSSSYDYFKYKGKINASPAAFNKRRDKYFFAKLSKHHDPQGLIVANIIGNSGKLWVGDLFNVEQTNKYEQWKKRQQSLSYQISSELSEFKPNFNDNFVVIEGEMPYALTLYLRNQICIETLIVLDDLCNFFRYWDSAISPAVVWEGIRFKADKYRPFLEYENDKLIKMITSQFEAK